MRGVVCAFREDTGKYLEPLQVGVGMSAGCEFAHKLVSSYLRIAPEPGILTLDIANAHNAVERIPALAQICAAIPPLAPYAAPWLTGSSKHTCLNDAAKPETIVAERGFDQGDPFSNIGFPLAVHGSLLEVESELRKKDPWARLVAYQDDFVILCAPTHFVSALALLKQRLAPLGLEIADKSAAYTLERLWSQVPADFPLERTLTPRLFKQSLDLDDTPRDVAVHVPSHDTSSDQSFRSASDEKRLIERRRHVVTELMRLHRAGLPMQVTLSLLRFALNGDATFASRLHRVSDETCKALDESLALAVAALAGEPVLQPHQRLIAALPLKEGGCGFLDSAVMSASAFVASWAENAPKISRRLGLVSAHALLERMPDIKAAFLRAVSFCRVHGAADASLEGLLVEDERHKVQAHLCGAITNHRRRALLGILPEGQQARLRSGGGPGAAAWLNPPTKAAHRLNDDVCKLSLRNRLLLDISPDGATCTHQSSTGQRCGRCWTAADATSFAAEWKVVGWRVTT
jgi:hypothetical protein